MSDDWGWFFTSAEGRTRMLRDQLETVESQAWAETSRLSSQLRTLQGSLETRLTALSAAFDAYVELGDIREQLASYPDTTVIRRDVARAIDALSGGRTADRVDDRGQAYWLPHAANALIAIASGGSDPQAEQAAHALSPAAELFIVAACGALGHGSSVADRLPSLMACDGRLNDDQLALWQGAVAGLYGPVLSAIGPVWSAALAETSRDVSSWQEWCHEHARSRDVDTTLEWIADLVGAVPVSAVPLSAVPVSAVPLSAVPLSAVPLSAVPLSAAESSPAQIGSDAVGVVESNRFGSEGFGLDGFADEERPREPPSEPAKALAGVVARLVAQGTDQEAPLLSRARELRERIENPGRRPEADADEPAATAIADAVRGSLLAAAAASAERVELVSWVAPALLAGAQAEATTMASLEPVRERVRTADATLYVGAEGPDRAELERARTEISARYPQSALSVGIAVVVGAVFAVGTVITLFLGSGWAFLLAILTVAIGIAAVRAERARRDRRDRAQAETARLDQDVAAVQHTVTARLDAREESRTRVSAALEAIRRRLRTEETPSG